MTGLLVDSGYREKRFIGRREEAVMLKLRDWWRQEQSAARLACQVGETLLCKATKAGESLDATIRKAFGGLKGLAPGGTWCSGCCKASRLRFRGLLPEMMRTAPCRWPNSWRTAI